MGRRSNSGKNGTQYLGVAPTMPPQMEVRLKAPTTKDYDFELGTLWLHKKPSDAKKSLVYCLADKQQHVATWILMRGGGSGASGFIAIEEQIFNTPGSFVYTPTPGMAYCFVECISGAGGSAGSSGPVTSDSVDFSGSAGGGAYAKSLFTSSDIGVSQSLMVGSGGAAGVGTAIARTSGGNGSDTTFGSFITCTGSAGSLVNTAGGVDNNAIASSAPGVATGGNLINLNGYPAGVTFNFLGAISEPTIYTGYGGNSVYGLGGVRALNVAGAGASGTGYGAGAAGSCIVTLADFANGAAGTGGIVIITEYIV